MVKPIFLIFILVFLVIIYILYKYSYSYFRQENSDKMWKLWGLRTPYWEGVVIMSLGINTLIMLSLKIMI
jgi:hypothetical protein